jgi:hypothetical protein
MPTLIPAGAPVRRVALLTLAFVVSLLSCGREITGPDHGIRFARGISFLVEFPGPLANVVEGAGSVVPFDRVRIRFLRELDGSVALDRIIDFGAETDSIELRLDIPLSPSAPESGEPLSLGLWYINAAGDTVFRGGPVSVIAVPSGRGAPAPQPFSVALDYTGPGSEASALVITPDTLVVRAGDAFSFSAAATDAQQAAVPDAPIVFTSRDTAIARITALGAGDGVARLARGSTWIHAALVSGVAADSAVLVVGPRAGSLVLVSGGDQAGLPGATLPDSIRVRLLATDGLGLGGAAVNIAVTTGGGSVLPPTLVTDDDGYATFHWTLGSAPGAQAVTVSADSVPDLVVNATASGAAGPTNITLVSGGDQTAYTGEPVPDSVIVRVTDASGTPMPGVAVAFAVTTGGGSLTGAAAETDADGRAAPGSWTLGATPGTNTITATVSGLTPLTITATGVLPPPAIRLAVFGSTVVGVERAGTLNVRLLQPAPAGGLIVTVVSDSAQYLTIAAPGTVTFAAGDTLGTIGVSGIALGTAVVRATAEGYAPDTLVVPVSLNLISLPTTLNVPLSQTRSLPVQISTPAPAEGVRVALRSSDPAVARPTQDSVTIAAGTQTVNATIEGLGLGTAVITATNPNYALDETDVSVTAEVNITNTSLSLNGSFGTTMTVRLESGGSPIGAPAGGVDLVFSADDPACVAVPAAATIAAGNVSIAVPVTYGGSATLACSTLVRALGPQGYTGDSVTANVAVVPAVNLVATANIASGLQRNIFGSLGASNHGGTTVRATSLDSSVVLLAPDAATVGSGTLDLAVGAGFTSFSATFQALEGRTGDTVSVVFEAPGFRPDTIAVRVWQPVLELAGVNTTGNTLSADDAFYAQVGTPNDVTGTAISSYDAVRAGGVPVVVSFVSDSTAVATLATSGLTADSLVLTIPAGTYYTPTTVAGGGVAVRYLGAGAGSVRASAPAYRALGGAVRGFTVSQPSITISGTHIGAGSQRALSLSTPGAPAPAGGSEIVLRPSRPGVVRLAPDAATVGSEDSLVVVIPAGATSAAFHVQGVEGIVADSVQVQATADGYTAGSAQYRVWQPIYEIAGLNTSATSLTADDAFYVQVATPSSSTSGAFSYDARSPGSGPLTVTVISDSSTVGTLVNAAGAVADTMTLSIPEGTYYTPTTVASGGVALRYLGDGVGTVQAVIGGLRALPTAVRSVTVTSPSVTVGGTTYLGSGLQRGRSVSLSAPAPADSARITLSADRPGVVLLSASSATVGADTVVLTIPPGGTSSTIYVQALDGIAEDSVTITATAPGFTSGAGIQRVFRAVFELSGLNTSPNTLSIDDPFQLYVGSPSSANGTSIAAFDERRPGAAPFVATVATSTATVGQLVTTARTGDTVTVQIPAGQYASPAQVADGGVAFDPLTTGSAVVSATIPDVRPLASAAGTTVTVSEPTITLANISSVGAGLQSSASGSVDAAQHLGITMVIRSSNPDIARVARFAGDTATESIEIPMANGVTNFSYYVVGMEGTTGQVAITASASGFADGSTVATVVAPRFEISGILSPRVAGSADDVFHAYVGVANATGSAIASYQPVRAGSPGLVFTFTSSDPAVGTLVTSTDTAATVQATIPPGSYFTPSTVATGGVAFRYLLAGTTTVTATTPTLQPTTAGGNQTVTVTAP